VRRRKAKGDAIKRRRVLTCPQCGSADLYYEAALITGYKYHCKRCNYIGAFVVEKVVEERTDDDESAPTDQG
jgi:DNA-directed RNA polymerase subunit M/transcription elongation factor TFIIS